MGRDLERMPGGLGSGVAGVLLFMWVELKALLFYPANFVMAVVQHGVQLGVWFFISLFLEGYAGAYVADFGGSYVAYVIIGVVFHETALTALRSPFASIQEAFWDKRLETYHCYPGGIWSHIVGRFLWSLTFSIVVQFALLLAILATVGLDINSGAVLWQALIVYVTFMASIFGIGLFGASTFFLIEVKRGIEPVGWLVDNAVRLTSGLFFPITLIPPFLRWMSAVLPHTYAYRSMRLILLQGETFASPTVRGDLEALLIFAAIGLTLGIVALRSGIRRAERRSGVGAVV